MEISTNKTIEIYFNESERKKVDAIIRRYLNQGATKNCEDTITGNSYEFCTQLQCVTQTIDIL